VAGQGSLFDDGPRFRDQLAERLAALDAEGIHIGTSSWKYQGWMGQIYTPERYFTRGRVSEKKFEAECLAEYGEVFPTVCGDFAFYQFPTPEYWARLFHSAPGRLKFAFKVPEEVTCRKFPAHARYGARAGQTNPNFLNRELLEGAFLRALEPFVGRVSVLIFEFGTFSGFPQFLGELEGFLGGLPGGFRYAVEVRNPELLGREYFTTLRTHGVAHVFNAWTRMPEIGWQMEQPGAFTADFSVTRALLRRGRSYEQAVAKFAPYTHTGEEQPGVRESLRALIARERKSGREAFIYVNNRLEGNAPLTIDAVV
jgi:uncharacterized protein YecE (DUF72 family)